MRNGRHENGRRERPAERRGADRQAPGQTGRPAENPGATVSGMQERRQTGSQKDTQAANRQAGGQTAAGRSLGDGAECVGPPPPASGSVLCRQPTRAEVSARQPAPCVRQRLALHHTVFHSVATDQGSPARTLHQTCDFSQCACVLSQPPLQPHVHALPSRAWINTGHKRGSNIPPRATHRLPWVTPSLPPHPHALRSLQATSSPSSSFARPFLESRAATGRRAGHRSPRGAA